MTTSLRTSMDTALKEVVVPVLRTRGFKGSLPHFRRMTKESVQLLTFQFDKWGGGFIAEIAICSIDGFTTHWGKHISGNNLTAQDLHPTDRMRIQPVKGSGTDAWSRFDVVDTLLVAQRFLEHLPVAESWWQEETQMAAQTNNRKTND
jgi:hypothetical protein